MKIAGRIFRNRVFSPCGKLEVCDVYGCPHNSDFTSAPPFHAASSSADLHPPLYQSLEALQIGCLLVLHPPKCSTSLLPRCEIWIIRITVDMNILHLTAGGKVPMLKTLPAVSFCCASSPYLLWGPFQ